MPAFAEQRAGVVIHFWTGLSKISLALGNLKQK
jgi:hypothetical protein